MKNISTLQKLAWAYAIMFIVLGSLRYLPFINDANGSTLGIFSLQWYDDLLHYASGVWAAWAAYRSFKDSGFYFKLFGLIYGLDGVMGLITGQGYLDAGIFTKGITSLDWLGNFPANLPHLVIGGLAVFIGFYVSKQFAHENVKA